MTGARRRGAAVVLAGGLAVGCGGPLPSGPLPQPPDRGGLVHVHGLGNNPANGQVYAATHTGIFRLGPRGPVRVAGRVQDTMGFLVIGPDRFLGSGHPGPADPGAADVGLIRSDDGGISWAFESSPVQRDRPLVLISIAARTGGGGSTTLAGVDSTGTAWTFTGSVWSSGTSAGGPPQAFAVLGPDRYVVATEQSVHSTEDAGKTWTNIAATR